MLYTNWNQKVTKTFFIRFFFIAFTFVFIFCLYFPATREFSLLSIYARENTTFKTNITGKFKVLLPKRICKEPITLLVIASSSPNHFARRQSVRETWGSDRNILNFIIDVYFIGLIEEEFQSYDDIIQEQFVDSYKNLSLKSVMMLKVVDTYCLNKTTYFMKTDDDMFVNLMPLVKVLTNSSETDLLLGHLHVSPLPKRNPNNKWYVSKSLYDKERYPSFLSGSGYVMSTDVVHRLYQESFNTKIFFLEDVYTTGMLAEAAGVERKGNSGFMPPKRNFVPCDYLWIITLHGYTDEELRKQFTFLKTSNLQETCNKTT